jgi:hypothetical protein
VPGIFISYRRTDAVALAGRIYDRLRARYGDDLIFLDRESIPIGQEWTDNVGQALQRADVLLAVIGPSWLPALANINDPVRHELEAALQRKIPVVPLLLASSFPSQEQLPASMQDLCKWQAMEVTPGIDFHHQMDRLIDVLDEMSPAAGMQEHLLRRRRWWAFWRGPREGRFHAKKISRQ